MPNGDVFAWSRTQELRLSGAEKMFAPAIEHVKKIALRIGCGMIVRCEYLQKPKHNVLAYDRVPKNHLAIFQIDFFEGDLSGPESIYNHGLLKEYAELYEIDVVPQFFAGTLGDMPDTFAEAVRGLHNLESFLGGPKIEGVVIKNFGQTDERTGATYLVGKVVREEFKEVHKHQVKLDKPDPVSIIGARCGGPARWQKAVQALTEKGELTGSMEDIPKLMRYVQLDVATEEEDAIKEALWKLYRKNVLGCTTKGLPEWWKQKLAAEYTDGGSGI
jgi:hypothetical protein